MSTIPKFSGFIADIDWNKILDMPHHCSMDFGFNLGAYRRPVVDVEYVDITECPISNPARLLTEYSMTPLYIEDRRRETFYIDIQALVDSITHNLSKFNRESLRMPRGINRCCPYKWEVKASDSIFDAFYELEEKILDALSVFIHVARPNAWQLWEFCGCNDSEYVEAFTEEKEALRLLKIQIEFLNAVHTLCGDDDDDDIPF